MQQKKNRRVGSINTLVQNGKTSLLVRPTVKPLLFNRWNIYIFSRTAHREDIGIECHSLAKLLASKIYWKGIEYSTSSKPLALQYVHISEAYEAIKGSEFLPDLHHVIVKNSVHGVRSHKMNSPLTISDSSIRDNKFTGIQIKGTLAETKILNSAVKNTTNGGGLTYYGILPDPVDFCSADVNNIAFPIIFQALGKGRTRVDCAKVRILKWLEF